MNAAVICHGCGQKISIPDEHQRNKIQCPGCGVICPVPAGATRPKPVVPAKTAVPPQAVPSSSKSHPKKTEDAAAARAEHSVEDILFGPDPIPSCPNCGRKVEAVTGRCGFCSGRRTEAPQPLRPKKAAAAPAEPRLSLDDPDDDEWGDGSPYEVAGGVPAPCPNCNRPLDPETVVCLSCGFNRQTRQKLKQEYQPIARSWETDWPLRTRLLIFLMIQGGSLGLGVLSAVLGGAELKDFALSWFLSGFMLAFLLGSYERIQLTRNRKGRVELSKFWRFAFVPIPRKDVPVWRHEGIVTGKYVSAGYFEWLVLLGMLISGVLPVCLDILSTIGFGTMEHPVKIVAQLIIGLIPPGIWWYFTIHKLTFFVALCRDHGFPETYVYKGWHEEQMHEIAETLRDASGLQLAQG
jgi:hypothetical protein